MKTSKKKESLYLESLRIHNGKGHVLMSSFYYIHDIFDVIDVYDVRLLGVNSIVNRKAMQIGKSLDMYGIIHVPQLGPSSSLLEKSYRWKEDSFNNDELNYLASLPKHNISDRRWKLYSYHFVNEMNNRTDFKLAFNRIIEHTNNGKNILLTCWCNNTMRCHISLIGLKLQKAGISVHYDYKSLHKLLSGYKL